MTHLTNEINQLEAVLHNVRREQARAVNDARAATEAARRATTDQANARLEVERLKETVKSLTLSLETLRQLNRNGGPPGGEL